MAKALLGKAALPDDLPYVTGSDRTAGSKPSYALMTECDTLLMIGSGFPYSEFLPEEGQARGVQIDISSRICSLCAIRWRSISLETRRKRCVSCCPFSAEKRMESGAGD